METTIVDRLYSDSRELIDYLAQNGEVSFQANVEDYFRKTLLLSVASYFESSIMSILMDFFEESANRSELVISFIRNKAIERQYHTYFAWREANANSFFGLLGSGFKEYMKAEVRNDAQLDESIRAFLKLGNSRNELVHGNFALYALQDTADEIYKNYKKATFFINVLPRKLREYSHTQRQTEVSYA